MSRTRQQTLPDDGHIQTRRSRWIPRSPVAVVGISVVKARRSNRGREPGRSIPAVDEGGHRPAWTAGIADRRNLYTGHGAVPEGWIRYWGSPNWLWSGLPGRNRLPGRCASVRARYVRRGGNLHIRRRRNRGRWFLSEPRQIDAQNKHNNSNRKSHRLSTIRILHYGPYVSHGKSSGVKICKRWPEYSQSALRECAADARRRPIGSACCGSDGGTR